MYPGLRLLFLFSCLGVGPAFSQHTFSIVAIDSITGEIGAAAATCAAVDSLGPLLNRIVPGVGAFNLQSHIAAANTQYALTLLRSGLSPQQIVDSLYKYDADKRPWDKQNLEIAFHNGRIEKAAFTGDSCYVYAGHIIGNNYAIAGNILSGRNILDSMQSGFTTAEGPLADKLMAALWKAKIPGADRRCAANNISSLSAFLRVARPSDSIEHYRLDLEVSFFMSSPPDPIDTLYDRFKKWKAATDQTDLPEGLSNVRILNNPGSTITVTYTLSRRENVKIVLYNSQGKMLKTVEDEPLERGFHAQLIELTALSRGLYFLDLNGKSYKIIKE